MSNSPTRTLILRPRSAFAVDELREIWAHRELLFMLGLRDVSVRYKQAVLGVAWALVQPVMQMLIFTLLFGRVAGLHADGAEPYALFVLSGLAVWLLFANGLSHSSESLVQNANLITKVYFPRVVIPLAALASSLVDFVFGFALLLVLMAYYRQPFHVTMIVAPLIAMISTLAAASLGLWTSALNLRFRDVRYALPFFIQLLIYATPVLYPFSALPPKWRAILIYNPMAAVVDSFRAAMFGEPLPLVRLGWSTLAIMLVGMGGFFWFRSVERTFADRV